MYSSGALSAFTLLGNHPHIHPQSSYHPGWNSRPSNSNSLNPVPQPHNHCSTSCLNEFDHTRCLLYKWNHTVFVLLWPDYFTEHNVLKVHHVAAYVRISFLFKAEWYSILCIYHILLIHSSIDGALQLLPPSGYCRYLFLKGSRIFHSNSLQGLAMIFIFPILVSCLT